MLHIPKLFFMITNYSHSRRVAVNSVANKKCAACYGYGISSLHWASKITRESKFCLTYINEPLKKLPNYD